VAALVAAGPLGAQPTAATSSAPSPSPAPSAPAAPPSAAPSLSAALGAWADRVGLWGSLGIGRGAAGLDCATCTDARTRAYGGHAIVGGRVTARFLVGAETFIWLDVMGGGVDRVARGTYLVARTYPSPRWRGFLHGGLGVAGFEANDGQVRFRTRSPSLSAGAGWDARLGTLMLTPSLTAIASTGGALTSDRTGNAVTERARLGLLRGAVALSWFR
jgi:hypothetical protein